MTATVQAIRSARTYRVMALVLLMVAGIAVYPGRAEAQKPRPAHAPSAQVGTFAPVTPQRLVDTKYKIGAVAPGPRGTTALTVTGANSVPSTGVTAVVLTVTVSASTASGYLTAYADGTTRPGTANLVFRTGHAVSDQVYAPVGADGKVSFYNGSSGTLRLIVDITGYFAAQAGAPAGGYVATTPTRTVDTRSALGGSPISARGTLDVAVLGHGPVPSSGVSAVAFTITALSPTATGYLTVYAGGTTRPPTANLYLSPGRSIANMAVSMVGGAGTVTIYNGSPASTQLVVDVTGYFLSGTPTAAGAFVAIPPVRNTREQAVKARAVGGTPATTGNFAATAAVIVNETVTGATSYGYSVVYGSKLRPLGSSLSFDNGPATAGMVTPSADLYELLFYNGSDGPARFTIDSFGYYIRSPGVGAVAGRVTDSSSHDGVAGVRVVSFAKVDPDSQDPQRDWSYAASTVTASDGSYQIPALWAGYQYWICFDTRLTPAPPSYTYSGQCWSNKPWPSSDDFNDVPGAALVTVTAGGTTDGINASLTAVSPGRVAGTVTTTGGDPLAAVHVSVTRTLDQVEVDTSTAADGTYQVAALMPGGYTVCFKATAPPTHTAPYGYVQQCQDVTVTAGATDRADAHLVAAGGISGRVSNVAGTPVTGVTVIGSNKAGSVTESVPVAADGTYTLTDLAPGSIQVCFDAEYASHPPVDGYLSQCYRNQPWSREYDAGLPSTLTPVTVNAGATTTGTDAKLVTAGAVSGTVTDTGGGGVSGITVYAFDSAGRRAGASGTAADGTYTMPELRPAVAYTVCFSDVHIAPAPTRYASQCWKNIPWSGNETALPAGTTAVTVTTGGNHTGIDATLTS
jgi:Carboxypeptidase regulatory-like domain